MSLLKNLSLIFVTFYRYTISPILPKCCRFGPSCSEYSIGCYKKYGFIIASILTIIRISKCHPWGKSGFDPVPENINSIKDIFKSRNHE